MGDVKMLSVPRLQSERLILEPLSRRHSAGMYALWSCPKVCRYAGPAEDPDGGPIVLPARSPADSDKIIDFFERGRAEGTRFRWAVLTRDGSAFIGAAGFNAVGRCAAISSSGKPISPAVPSEPDPPSSASKRLARDVHHPVSFRIIGVARHHNSEYWVVAKGEGDDRPRPPRSGDLRSRAADRG